jgi:hypothetical protein
MGGSRPTELHIIHLMRPYITMRQQEIRFTLQLSIIRLQSIRVKPYREIQDLRWRSQRLVFTNIQKEICSAFFANMVCLQAVF